MCILAAAGNLRGRHFVTGLVYVFGKINNLQDILSGFDNIYSKVRYRPYKQYCNNHKYVYMNIINMTKHEINKYNELHNHNTV